MKLFMNANFIQVKINTVACDNPQTLTLHRFPTKLTLNLNFLGNEPSKLLIFTSTGVYTMRKCCGASILNCVL